MDLADCYRILGLRSGAPFEDIKASYRRLARKYHPDANQGNQQAKEKFIELNEAYRLLMEVVKPLDMETQNHGVADVKIQTQSHQPTNGAAPQSPPEIKIKVQRKSPRVQFIPPLSAIDQRLKQHTYEQLQQLLKSKRFPRAIAVVEGLAERLPKDPEIRQWQAITYQRMGRHLVDQKQLDKARIYLKKALKTDPRNRSLWAEVEKDFRRIEQMF